MKEGIRFAHEHGAKVHVTVNILAHNEDLAGVWKPILKELKRNWSGCTDYRRSSHLSDGEGDLSGD